MFERTLGFRGFNALSQMFFGFAMVLLTWDMHAKVHEIQFSLILCFKSSGSHTKQGCSISASLFPWTK